MLGATVDYDLAVACLDRANNSSQVRAIDAEISSLNTSWNPTGFFTATSIASVLDKLATEIQNASAALQGAPDSTSSASSDRDSANRAMGDAYWFSAKSYRS